ncbi:MAG: response regulator, partial [Gammaproteobacteria bacterium]|nr:response regulator [Gammaproteobacteria bacterium]
MIDQPRRAKLLIIDDEPGNIDILVELLSHHYTVTASGSGEKGVKIARREPHPDLILLDVQMPEMDGYAVCEELKRDPLTSAIPVVFLTGSNSLQDQIRGLEQGAIDYITKPFHIRIVEKKVFNYIQQRQQCLQLEDRLQQEQADLVKTQEVILDLLASMAEVSNRNSPGHLKRIEGYMELLATELLSDSYYRDQMSEALVMQLARSAPLHDLGKVAISANLLNKEGGLTQE